MKRKGQNHEQHDSWFHWHITRDEATASFGNRHHG
jgi:hypothetical protein